MDAENREEFEVVEGQPAEPAEQQDPSAAEPAEHAEDAEPAPAEVPDPEAVKQKGVQKRIDEITRARRQAESEAEYWRKVATGEIKPPQQVQQPQPESEDFVPPGFPPEPNLDAFDDYEKYNRALVRWEAGRIIAARDYQSEQSKVHAAKQTVIRGHAARMDAARAKYQDLDEVIDAADVVFPQSTFDVIVESDQSAEIAYHLAKNPAESARIAALSPVQQIKELARLEDKFKATTPQPIKRVTQAPTPISALGGNGEIAGKDPEKMSDEEWLAYERNRVAKLGRRY